MFIYLLEDVLLFGICAVLYKWCTFDANPINNTDKVSPKNNEFVLKRVRQSKVLPASSRS